MKKAVIAIIMICTIFTTVFASAIPESKREYLENGNTYVVKQYEVTEDNVNEFERNIVNSYKDGLKIFKLDNISRSGGTTTISKEETQIKVVETDSDKIEDILPLFQSEIEYLEDDDYFGTLVLDTSSITMTKVSDGSYYKKYTIADNVEYRNYSRNDMDKIPKTRVKNGINMTLVGVEWKVQNAEMIGSSQVPVSYIAIAHYKGMGTTKVEGQKKFTSSATYRGTITKIEEKPLEYELTYIKTSDFTILVIISSVLGVIGIGFILLCIIKNTIKKYKYKKAMKNKETRRLY